MLKKKNHNTQEIHYMGKQRWHLQSAITSTMPSLLLAFLISLCFHNTGRDVIPKVEQHHAQVISQINNNYR